VRYPAGARLYVELQGAVAYLSLCGMPGVRIAFFSIFPPFKKIIRDQKVVF